MYFSVTQDIRCAAQANFQSTELTGHPAYVWFRKTASISEQHSVSSNALREAKKEPMRRGHSKVSQAIKVVPAIRRKRAKSKEEKEKKRCARPLSHVGVSSVASIEQRATSQWASDLFDDECDRNGRFAQAGKTKSGPLKCH